MNYYPEVLQYRTCPDIDEPTWLFKSMNSEVKVPDNPH